MTRDLLLLARAPLAASAVANMGLGLFLAWEAAGRPDAAPATALAVACLVAATVCIYWAGMVLNDWFDRGRDATLHPGRPLPAGRIRSTTALRLGLALLGAGVGAAALAGALGGPGWVRGLAAGAALALCVLAYDGLLKRFRLLGSLAMGSCRSANALMGAFALGLWNPAAAGLAAPVVIYALLLGAYVTFLTLLSTYEDEDAGPAALAFGFGGVLAVPAALVWLGFAGEGWGPGALAGALPLAAVCLVQLVKARAAGTRARGGQSTRALLRSIWLVDAAVLLGRGGWFGAPALLGLYLIGTYSARALFAPPRAGAAAPSTSGPESETGAKSEAEAETEA